jgi:hypothetical protein
MEYLVEDLPEYKPAVDGYCEKCCHGGIRNNFLWCYSYGKKADEIKLCNRYYEDLSRTRTRGENKDEKT